MKISVVIPCLNEHETLFDCIQEAKQGLKEAQIEGEVIVADNGSTDGSQQIAQDAGAFVVNVNKKGYGNALHYGIMAAHHEIVVMGDADMSYPFTSIKILTEKIVAGQADFVLGSRLGGEIEDGAMPFLNRFMGTPILSFLIRVLYGLPVSDCNSGLRAFKKSTYLQLKLSCPGMEYASEMLIRVFQNNIRYGEAPIRFRPDRRSHPPHLSRWRDGWRHLKFIISNSPALRASLIPGIVGAALTLAAFILSFEQWWNPSGPIHYHMAFILISTGMPMMIFTNTFLIVRMANLTRPDQPSRMIKLLESWSENAALFYWSFFLYILAFLQAVWVAFVWWKSDFGPISEIPSIIRMIALSITATSLFCLDMGLGVTKLFIQPSPENKHTPFIK